RAPTRPPCSTCRCPVAAPASASPCPACTRCCRHDAAGRLGPPRPAGLSFDAMNPTRSALIVDDERDIRELLVLTLGRMGLRVDTAANLAEARGLLGRERYDLCFTDMRLPDGNGIELGGEIARQHP